MTKDHTNLAFSLPDIEALNKTFKAVRGRTGIKGEDLFKLIPDSPQAIVYDRSATTQVFTWGLRPPPID